MKRLILIFWVLATGCMPAAEETLLTELRVISMVSDPPVIDILGGSDITSTTYRPDTQPIDTLMWTCAPGPLGCLEAGIEEFPQAVSTFTTTAQPEGEDVMHSVAANPFLANLGDELPPAQVWTLSCWQGLCPVIDQVRSDPEPGSDAWRSLIDTLSDPFALLEGLPIEGTAASFKVLPMMAVDEERPAPKNPVITPLVEGELTVPSGGTLPLAFEVQAEATTVAVPLASAGGFVEALVEVKDGKVTVEMVAGSAESEDQPPVPAGTRVKLYVAFEAEDAGSALWRGEVTVTEAP